MYCGKCGAKNEDNAECCSVCGAKLKIEKANGGQPDGANIVDKIKKIDTKKIDTKKIGIAAAVIIVLVIVASIGNKISKTVNLNDYLEVTYEGYNGYGTVDYHFDKEKFEDDFGDKIKMDDSEDFVYGMIPGEEIIEGSISGEFDKESELSNGDEINFTWDVDTENFDHCNLTFKYKDEKYTVSGLEDMPVVDPFSYIDVVFEGTAPNGQAKLVQSDTSDGTISTGCFSLSESYGLSEGDTVTVTLVYTAEEFIDRYEMAPSKISQDYVVSGLAVYVSSADEITEDVLDSMVQQGNDAFTASTAYWNERNSVSSVEYVGNYFATAKFDDQSVQNSIYLLYQVTAAYSDDNNDLTTDYYYVVKYDNILKEADGTISVDVSKYQKLADWSGVEVDIKTNWGDSHTYYDGYATLTDFETSVLTGITEKYTYKKNLTK